MIENIPEKTGKSIDAWKTILKGKSFEKHSEGVKYLKSKHGVTHGFANIIVTLSKEENNAPINKSSMSSPFTSPSPETELPEN